MVSRSCAAFVFSCSAILGAMLLSLCSAPALAAVSLPPFYEAAAKIIPDGKLGDIVKQEKVPTPIAGAQAWRIAYIASDIADRKTVVTALVIAPTGEAPLEGRPIVAWAHGTTGAAQNCGPSQVPNPAQPLSEYFCSAAIRGRITACLPPEEFIRSGYVLVATDYQGLGGRRPAPVHGLGDAGARRDRLDPRRRRLEGNRRRQTGADLRLVAGGSRWSPPRACRIISGEPARHSTASRWPALSRWRQRMSRSRCRQKTDEDPANELIGGLRKTFSANVFQFAHMAMTFSAIPAAFPDSTWSDVFTGEGAQIVDEVVANNASTPRPIRSRRSMATTSVRCCSPKAATRVGWAQALLKGSVPPLRPVAPVIIYWGNKERHRTAGHGRALPRADVQARRQRRPRRACRRANALHHPARSPSRSMCRGSRTASPASPRPMVAPRRERRRGRDVVRCGNGIAPPPRVVKRSGGGGTVRAERAWWRWRPSTILRLLRKLQIVPPPRYRGAG